MRRGLVGRKGRTFPCGGSATESDLHSPRRSSSEWGPGGGPHSHFQGSLSSFDVVVSPSLTMESSLNECSSRHDTVPIACTSASSGTNGTDPAAWAHERRPYGRRSSSWTTRP